MTPFVLLSVLVTSFMYCALAQNTCTTTEGQQGTCVNIHSCEHLLNRLKAPVSKETIAYVRKTRCNGPEQYSVCCGPPPNTTVKPVNPDTCILTAALPDPQGRCCGLGAAEPSKITGSGGTAALLDQYPWLALIEYFKDDKIKLLCGGTLISGKYVLTAGHCVLGSVLKVGTPKNVRLGEYDTSHDGADCVEIPGDGQDCTEDITVIPIEKIIAHPDYKPDQRLSRNDIALLRLKETAPYTDFIRPICLPTSDITLNPPARLNLYMSGWGAVSDTVSKSNVKLEVVLPFKSLKDCQPLYALPKRNVTLWNRQLCAGGEGLRDSCKGDSGGPLMHADRGRFEIVGVVSFGIISCGVKNVPGIYTKVYEYNDWIRSEIKP